MKYSHELFLETYEDVKRINHLDLVSSDLRYAKTLEEMGELFQVYNKILGRKIGPNDTDIIRKEILEETADVIQCIYSLVEARTFHEKTNFDHSTIIENVTSNIEEDFLGWTFVDWMEDIMSSISFLRSLDINCTQVALALDGVLEIARRYNISLDDIHTHILEVKNPKWEKIIEKLNLQNT